MLVAWLRCPGIGHGHPFNTECVTEADMYSLLRTHMCEDLPYVTMNEMNRMR